MPQFQLDTEGTVGRWDGAQLHFYDDLDAFTQGYVEALFFTNGEDLEDKGFSDLEPHTLQCIIEDCREFQKNNAATLSRAYVKGYSEDMAGHDFWLTRNGHGAGFWDREELSEDDLCRILATACRVYGECEVYLGDDGKVYA